MKCIKCGYTSFDHLSECKKCGINLSDARESLNLPAMEPSVPFLLGALLDGRDSTGSGEQESAAVEAQADVIESIEMLSLDSPETEELTLELIDEEDEGPSGEGVSGDGTVPGGVALSRQGDEPLKEESLRLAREETPPSAESGGPQMEEKADEAEPLALELDETALDSLREELEAVDQLIVQIDESSGETDTQAGPAEEAGEAVELDLDEDSLVLTEDDELEWLEVNEVLEVIPEEEAEEASADAAEAIELELSEEDLEGLVLELGGDLEEAEPDPKE
ncbi:MAG: hypothetical protein SWC40_10100 [Thermodesulfobacteriota bacterium]|nr:hypothetical protein [Thermodesulfobacteriota bacterium]